MLWVSKIRGRKSAKRLRDQHGFNAGQDKLVIPSLMTGATLVRSASQSQPPRKFGNKAQVADGQGTLVCRGVHHTCTARQKGSFLHRCIGRKVVLKPIAGETLNVDLRSNQVATPELESLLANKRVQCQCSLEV